MAYLLRGSRLSFVINAVVSRGLVRIFSCLVATGACIGCVHEPFEPELPQPSIPVYSGECSPDSVYFENHIVPILITRCGISSCHDNETYQSDLNLMDYQSLMASGVVVPGNAAESMFYQVLTGSAEVSMPPAGEMTLTAHQKEQIAQWIDQGARHNACIEACDTLSVSYALNVLPIIEDRCQWCHGQGPNVAGGLLLVGYGHISTAAMDGLLMNAILGQNGYEPMPSVGPALTDCQVMLIQQWIADGAPQN